MKISSLTFTLASLLVTAIASGQPLTDFSGRWEMNPDKGQNLGMAAAVKQTVTITQTDEVLIADYTNVFQGNTTTRQVTYDLAGEPVVNYTAMGEESRTIAAWQDDSIVTSWTSEGAIAGTEVVRTETRSLSEGGKTMIVETQRDDRPPLVMVYDRLE